MEKNNTYVYAGIVVLLLMLTFLAIYSKEASEPSNTPDDFVPSVEEEEEVPELTGEYNSGFLPAASTPGREYTLTLNEDYTATLVADYKTEERPVVDTGTWEVNDTIVTLTFTDRFGFPLEETVVMDFEVAENALSLVEYDKSRWGVMGLSLSKTD